MGDMESAINDIFSSLSQWSLAQLPDLASRMVVAIIVVIIGRWLSRWAVRALTRWMERGKMDSTLVSFFGKVVYFSLLAVVFVIALGMLGIPTSSVIAVLGASTLALGLALQDTLSNFAAGILIISLRPYNPGDLVDLGGTRGTVEDIRFFHTVLRTLDNSVLFVPNNDIMDGTIVNLSNVEWRRVDMVFGIGYGDDLRKAKQILREIVDAHPLVAKEPEPTIAVMELGDSSVNFAVRPFARPDDFLTVQFDITEQVKLRFDAEGISIPFPQRDVHIYQN